MNISKLNSESSNISCRKTSGKVDSCTASGSGHYLWIVLDAHKAWTAATMTVSNVYDVYEPSGMGTSGAKCKYIVHIVIYCKVTVNVLLQIIFLLCYIYLYSLSVYLL